MQWLAAYSVGIGEIDSQHKELLRLFGAVESTVKAKTNWSEVHLRIVEVRKYAEFHFHFEEALMRLYGYGKAAEHAGEHRKILDKVLQIERAVITETTGDDVIRFFRDWLVNHIKQSDRGYADLILGGAPVVRAAEAS